TWESRPAWTSGATPRAISVSRMRRRSSASRKASTVSTAFSRAGCHVDAKTDEHAERRGARRGPAVGRRRPAMTAESVAAKKARARKILARLHKAYPGATIALHFRSPLELLVATILSAQCTDERVNMVTEMLFQRYRSAKDYAESEPVALERDIHATG